MSYLADACALVAFHGFGGATMSAEVMRLMESGDVHVSPVTVWEITRKVALGKLERPTSGTFRGSYADHLRSAGYRVTPVGWEEAEYANRLPAHHKDPMDRMLIATALLRDLTIISNDSMFSRYAVATLW